MALSITSMIITVCYGNGTGYQLCQVCVCFANINLTLIICLPANDMHADIHYLLHTLHSISVYV